MGVLSNAISGAAHAVADHMPSFGMGGSSTKATSFDSNNGAWEFRKYVSDACPHCRHLAPAWSAAESAYSGPVKFRTVTCADDNWMPVKENEKLCENIMGFPTMKMFKGDAEVAEYSGGRSKDDLLNYVNTFDFNNVRPAAMPVAALVAATAMTAMGFESAEEASERKARADFL